MTRRARIEVIDYDARWPLDFSVLHDRLAAALAGLAVAIEHVGSTAVPGLASKPIIDIDVVIESRDRLPEIIAVLAAIGYAHEGNRGIPGREAFRRSDNPPDGSLPRHHLYVCAEDSGELARHLALRDRLRQHPDQAAAYGRLKREIARRFPDDIDSYIQGKAAFIESVCREVQA